MTAPHDRATTLPVYVLIGGKSRRFGAPKALHPVDGEPWALHVGRRLAARDEAITLVGGERPAGELGRLAFAQDADSAVGPLAGVWAALADRSERFGPGWLVLASCDLVRPERGWIDSLFETATVEPQAAAVVYRTGPRWQPFPSVLHTRMLELLANAERRGDSLQQAFDRAGAVAIEWPHDSEGPPQANRPEDLATLLASPQES